MTGLERHAWLIYAFLTLFLWGYFSPNLTSASKVFGLRALVINGGIMFLIGVVTLFFSGPVSYTGADLKIFYLDIRHRRSAIFSLRSPLAAL